MISTQVRGLMTRFRVIHREAIIPLKNRLYHNVLAVSLMWYMGGLLVFHTQAFFSVPGWDNAYYIWDKTSDVLWLVGAHKSFENYRKYIAPILFYSIIRLCFQIAALFLPMEQNANWIVTILFTLALSVLIYLTLNVRKK